MVENKVKVGQKPFSGVKLIFSISDNHNYELFESIDNPYEPVAPPPEEGGPNLTAHELKGLHKRQSLNL